MVRKPLGAPDQRKGERRREKKKVASKGSKRPLGVKKAAAPDDKGHFWSWPLGGRFAWTNGKTLDLAGRKDLRRSEGRLGTQERKKRKTG